MSSRNEMLTARQWAEREFGSIDLKDKRLNRRAIRVAEQVAADPSASLPRQAGGDWARTKATYRLFDHPHSTFESVCRPHWERTRSLAAGGRVVLEIQDTTTLDYRHHPATRQGTGWTNADAAGRPQGNGLFLHSVLCVRPRVDGSGSAVAGGQVLGLSHARIWARGGEPTGKDARKRSRRRHAADRESLRWSAAVGALGDAPRGVRRVHVGDRESDIYGFYEQTRRVANTGFVIRLKQDRNACPGHDTPDTRALADRKGGRLKDVIERLPALGQTRLWIAPRAGRAGREARLRVSAGPVTIWSPQTSRTGRALRCWAVLVREVGDVPGGAQPVEWVLLTSEPADDLASACRIAGYYGLRWLVEEFHQCLKSGCRVEERQLETADRLEPLVGMLSVVAVRLLQMKNDARLEPDRPAIECVAEPALVRTLGALTGIAPEAFTVRSFVREVAKRGGFLGRAGDGEPGWRTLWQGWRDLTLIHAGYQMAQRDPRYG